jgi:hypothetical protein
MISIQNASVAIVLSLSAMYAYGGQIIFQPGPDYSQDIWTTSIYSNGTNHDGTANGVADEKLWVGGWGDYYYTYFRFDLSGLPLHADSAVVQLYSYRGPHVGFANVSMFLDRVTEEWDYDRARNILRWSDRPASENIGTISAPSIDTWYSIDITTLYNQWQSGTRANYGIALRPTANWNRFNYFWSSRYTNNSLRPRLVITSGTPLAPRILHQPANTIANAGSSATFSVSATGDIPLAYQWRFNGQPIAGATNSNLTVANVTANNSGFYSVRVSNSAGDSISANASLAVLTAIIPGAQPSAPVYPPAPISEAGKDSLILITHGRTVGSDTHDWVDDMKASIKQSVPNNWMVLAHKWTEQAAASPVTVLSRAKSVGRQLGRSIMNIAELTPNQAWSHVHLIAHSAGADVIDEASRIVALESPPLTTVHTTFLDPYTGATDGGRAEYGRYANWSDSYYSIDDETYDRVIGRTEGRLDHAHNVDITWLDPSSRPAPDIYVSGVAGSTPAILPQRYSTHSWPRQFYQQSIPHGIAFAPLYGYPMSKEGGGWPNRYDHPKGNTPIVLNGVATPPQNSLPVRIDQQLNIGQMPYATSDAGASYLGGSSFQLGGSASQLPAGRTVQSPSLLTSQASSSTSWLAVAVSVTSVVNVVAFDSAFTGSASSNALLTVYWMAEEIGLLDQLTTGNELVSTRFALPVDAGEGIYTLSFRLDTFGIEDGGVIVSNIAVGFVGYIEPIRLAVTSIASNAGPELTVSGPAGFNYLLNTSSNLVDWTPSTFIANETGSVHWIDTTTSNQVQQFYRAVLP